VILSCRRAPSWRVLAVAAAAALAPAIAGCEAGANAPTQRWHQPTAGASTVVDNAIRINNMFVLGAPPDSALTAGSSAGLFLALANSGPPDRLIQITAPGSAGTVELPAGGVRLGTEQSVLLTGPAPQVILHGLTHRLGGGQYILVVLHFLRAGRVPLRVPVMPRAQYFATFSPAPVPVAATPSPSASPSPSPTG
jgi:hypothetical protein